MQINLRKATALKENILSKIKNLEFDAIIELNEFIPIEEQISNKFNSLNSDLKLKTQYLFVLYDIRKRISRANAEKIDDLLCDLALMDKLIESVSDIISAGEKQSDIVLEGNLQKLRNNPPMYGYNKISSSVLSEEFIRETNKRIDNLKRDRERLKEEILSLNITTTIELPDENLKFLEEVGIL